MSDGIILTGALVVIWIGLMWSYDLFERAYWKYIDWRHGND